MPVGDRIEAIEEKVDKLCSLITGNGQPKDSIAYRLASLEDKFVAGQLAVQSLIRRAATATVMSIVVAIGVNVARWVTGT